MTKSNLFITAWNIARQGAAKFGGLVRSYFATALRQAYVALKTVAETRITITTAVGRGKSYVALITGLDAKYKYARTFLQTAPNGEKLNCYVGLTTVATVPVGSIIETMTANYKGKQTRRWVRAGADRDIEITEFDVAVAFS